MDNLSLNFAKSTAQSRWYHVIDPVTKLLLVAVFTLASFLTAALPELAGLLVVALSLLLAARVGRQALSLIGFSSFLIVTMFVIQGLFYSQNQTVLVNLGGVSIYREGVLYATTLGCRVLVVILITSFFIFTTTISENTHYLEQVGVPHRMVYVVMSVCYVLPQIMSNMRQIQTAQRVRGINPQKTVIQRVRAIVPVLVPLIIKTLTQSMERAIVLQLRGFDQPHRQRATAVRHYWHPAVGHIGLSLVMIGIVGWKIGWLILNNWH